MMLWSQIRHRGIKTFTNQCKRGCVASPNYTKTSRLLDRNILFNQSELYGFTRCYAAPVLANQPQPEPKDENVTRLNEDITADFIRLVFADGHEVVSMREALKRARELKLDLVEVDRAAKPPVCKIMDYHREQYKHKQELKERKKSKAEKSLRKGAPKEVRFAAKTEQKDLETKAMQVKKLMEKGFRVKCMATGKEEDANLGGLLSRLLALMEDVAIIESGPFVEKTQAYALVRHIKYGLPKKSGKKKPTKSVPASTVESEPVQAPIETQDKESEDDSEPEQDYTESEEEDFNPSKVETPRIPPPPPRQEINDNNKRHDGGRNKKFPPTSDRVYRGPGATSAVVPPRLREDRNGGGRVQAHRNSGGSTQVGENRYGDGRDKVRTNQRPSTPEFSPPRVHRDAGLPPQVGGGRAQVHRDSGIPPMVGGGRAQVYRDSGATSQGPTQVGDNRYGGGRVQVQPTKPLENTGEDTSEASTNTRPPQRSSYGIFSAPRHGGNRK
ncbi:hypothetical protein ACHQM5_024575 [Ranunculus cassubicifolius]